MIFIFSTKKTSKPCECGIVFISHMSTSLYFFSHDQHIGDNDDFTQYGENDIMTRNVHERSALRAHYTLEF